MTIRARLIGVVPARPLPFLVKSRQPAFLRSEYYLSANFYPMSHLRHVRSASSIGSRAGSGRGGAASLERRSDRGVALTFLSPGRRL